MSNIKITQEIIDRMMERAETKITTVFGKCTIVSMQFENGFVLVGSSACVDPANYDVKLGTEIAKKQIENKLWELEGYALQKALHKLTKGE